MATLVGVFTYVVLIGPYPLTLSEGVVNALIILNFALLLSLFGLIAWRGSQLWAERRAGQAGARLHARMVAWFVVIAVVPTILVAVFAVVTLNLGVQNWFSPAVRDALGSSVNVSQVYVNEHKANILVDVSYIADNLQRDPSLFDENKNLIEGRFFARLDALARSRSVRLYLYDGEGAQISRTAEPACGVPRAQTVPCFNDPPPPTPADIAEAQKTVWGANPRPDLITALTQLRMLTDAYLMVVRVVDPNVQSYYLNNRAAVTEYNRLDQNRQDVQYAFFVVYALVALLVLLGAIWAGIWAANRLVRPISTLIAAADRVSEGDLEAQVPVEREDDEIGTLGRTFNRMTQQLVAQRADLVDANRQLDQRRRFTETVLSGVSAGVVGVDQDGKITIVNRAAARLLDAEVQDMEDSFYAASMPELAALIRRAMEEPVGRASGEVQVKRGAKTRTLSVQVASEKDAQGFVVTFDDISDLVSAQRTAAWADVARRIAHEIKNPLTPIQLSAERLKRKYGGEITTDPDVFNQCTDTIVRQVGDIGRMVDEFSSFARMPAPVMKRENAQELLSQAIFLQRVAHPEIAFTTEAPKDAIHFEGDGRLISQALTNVLKNAGEGIAARHAKGDDAPGRITVALEPNGSNFAYRITDNGIGLPPEHLHRLTEPYVTTRAKGTGLGLAIVRKIMEDHGGEIALSDRESGEGAQVVLTLPFAQKSMKGREEDGQKRIADRV
ncbi:MAG TPA: PAS domain-containing sensor histidine kinase [Rhizomicrobium sp.]|nr:PAS domain-containing sensor histidine kinase [Rhizomicrobium sp.]